MHHALAELGLHNLCFFLQSLRLIQKDRKTSCRFHIIQEGNCFLAEILNVAVQILHVESFTDPVTKLFRDHLDSMGFFIFPLFA